MSLAFAALALLLGAGRLAADVRVTWTDGLVTRHGSALGATRRRSTRGAEWRYGRCRDGKDRCACRSTEWVSRDNINSRNPFRGRNRLREITAGRRVNAVQTHRRPFSSHPGSGMHRRIIGA